MATAGHLHELELVLVRACGRSSHLAHHTDFGQAIRCTFWLYYSMLVVLIQILHVVGGRAVREHLLL